MSKMKFDIDYVREQFPALCKTVNGYPAAFLDGPGGTQTPKRVVEALTDYLYYRNANGHGVFKTSRESEEIVTNTRATFADFFNCSPEEVVIGENTSTNNFKLTLALARELKPGDEVLITDIDHEGNRSPWRTLEDFGAVIKSVKIHATPECPDDISLDYEDFKSKLSSKTKIFAINWAANSCGTITDVKKFIEEAKKVGALTIVDGVHYAPHRAIDVQEAGMDILQTSAYKYFGPHLGVMYCKKEVGDKLKSGRVMADDNTEMPVRLETGTPAMELHAASAAAVEFIADIGAHHTGNPASERRKNIVAGMAAIDEYEETLAKQLRDGLAALPGVRVYGPLDPNTERTSTVSFTIDGINANAVAQALSEKGIFVWDGDFYAIETIMNVLKLESVGGFVRIGLAPYNIQEEIDRVLDTIRELVA